MFQKEKIIKDMGKIFIINVYRIGKYLQFIYLTEKFCPGYIKPLAAL